MTNQDFTFYTSADYWQELLASLKRAGRGDRLAVMVMSMNPVDPIIAQVLTELMAAAGRGANVHVVVDAYNFLIHLKNDTPGPLWWRAKLGPTWRSYRGIQEALRALERQPNTHVTVINMPTRAFTNPKSGRSHIKFTVINNRVFIGGCNLGNTDWLDAMLSWTDQHIADYLYHLVQELERVKSTKVLLGGDDRTIAIDTCTSLLIDSGKKRQSLIFDQAMELIDAAEKFVLITCQYFPNGTTAQHLVAARQRGVQVQIVYGHPAGQGPIGSLIQQASAARERLRVPGELFRDRLPKAGPGIHAKIIATEKGAIIGSNNYVYAGVLFGTAEMAVLRHDAAFSASMVNVVERLLAGTPLSIRK
jgi:phosphatidylserine/phosphatidylglycerophosphate/cardiolipin synthase-like enzyme